MKATFDYVIVGAGAAGALLATRLTEDGTTTVCLLEAGPADWHPYLHVPAGFIKVLFDPAYTWPYQTEATAQIAGRAIPIPQGRVLGGSTSMNGLVFNRGQKADFDDWAARGNTGWAYDDVLPYFKRYENRIGAGDDRYRGRSGELPVTDIDWRHPINEAFIAGAVGIGMPRNADYNGATQEGVGYFQRTIHRGRRMSTSKVFLKPARSRANLLVKTHAHATTLLFDGRRAVGVRYARNRSLDALHEVRARREVILCAGALNTPKLLQLSGLGAGTLLQKLGVPVVHDLPGVGENLTDHYSVRLVARAKNSITMNELSRGPRLWAQIARWMLGRPNILALSPSLVHFFCRSRTDLDRPDLQGVFSPASYRAGYVGMLDGFPGMTCGVWLHRPKSTGHVRARSTDPFAAPLIQPNYFSEASDQRTLVDGIRIARRLLQTPELSRFVDAETLPGPTVQTDDELLDFARRFGVSSYHVNGTARMGPDGDRFAVVDDRLRVRGVDALRIVDASVMPVIPSANTVAATMMIAEKASDLIRGRMPSPAG
ncbi:MAG: GMC family oxidoreductase N-terminal domain-containing protein [Burkholderiales bacterium]|nr:GMC family oxidoreductase N-terminal domain-containing protein [Burkholderiales bacterium]